MSKPIVKPNLLLPRLTTVGAAIYPLVAHTTIAIGYPVWTVYYLLMLMGLFIINRMARWRRIAVIGFVVCLIMLVMTTQAAALLVQAIYLPPIIIPAWLAIIFGASLWSSEGAVISRIAAVIDGKPLEPRRVLYTRRLTLVWTGLFCLMVIEAIVLGIWASFAVWSWWVHVGNYLLVLTAITVEWWLRRRVFGDKVNISAQLRALALRPWQRRISHD